MVSSLSLPWTEKYKPLRVSEIVGNEKALSELVGFLKNWKRNLSKKALLLYGSPGNGKTVSVYEIGRAHV
jgi:replication factor C large subunit